MKELRSSVRKRLADIAAIVDAESNLPAPGRRLIAGVWVDTLPGEPGWTLRVRDIYDEPDVVGVGRYRYEIDDEIADRITQARAKPARDRTAREAVLAAGGAPRERPPKDTPGPGPGVKETP